MLGHLASAPSPRKTDPQEVWPSLRRASLPLPGHSLCSNLGQSQFLLLGTQRPPGHAPPTTSPTPHSSLQSTVCGPTARNVPLIPLPIYGPPPGSTPEPSLPVGTRTYTVYACLCAFYLWCPLCLALGKAQVSSKYDVERCVKGERQEETWNFKSPTYFNLQ